MPCRILLNSPYLHIIKSSVHILNPKPEAYGGCVDAKQPGVVVDGVEGRAGLHLPVVVQHAGVWRGAEKKEGVKIVAP